MSAWFDVLSTNDVRGGIHDEAGMLRSARYLRELIEEEIKTGIPASKILLGGFSQGGAISLLTGIMLPFVLGGVFSLCGYLPMIPRVMTMEDQLMPLRLRRELAMFMGNGTNDPKVKFPWGEWSAVGLAVTGYDVDFRSYLFVFFSTISLIRLLIDTRRKGHCMHPAILSNIAEWIDFRLSLDDEDLDAGICFE
jgi:predicted esterase